MAQPTRWHTDTPADHSIAYAERFRKLAAEGKDIVGEARLVDAMLPRASRILDAGCGGGRLGAYLAAAGHTVVGVDADPILIDAARADHPEITWLVADLTELDLPAHGIVEPFDAAVLAGNVMPFLAPDTEILALSAIAAHLRADAPAIVGFHLDRNYTVDAFDAHAAAAGFTVEQRFGTWDLRPFTGEDYAVTVLRLPAQDSRES